MDNMRSLINFSILNANWRNGKNYLDTFVPFVEELFARKKYEEVNLDRICQDFNQEFLFRIPHHPMKAVLKRLVRFGKIEYCGKEVWKNKKTPLETIISIRKNHENKYQGVLCEFINFIKKKYNKNIDEGQANNVFISFLERQDASLLFFAKNNEYLLPKVDFSIKLIRQLAEFIKLESDKNSGVFQHIVEIAAGHMLAATIVNEAKQPYEEKIKKIRIYCDTSHILKLLGLDGDIQQKMIEELFGIFTTTKCQLVLFKHTYDEIVQNVKNAKRWLNDPNRNMNKASKTLLHFVSNNYTDLEVDILLNRIDKELEKNGVDIEDAEYNTADNKYNIDDKKLKELIVEEYRKTNEFFDEDSSSRLLDNDVRSINMVYRRIRRKYPNQFKDIKVVFMCANSSLAKICKNYHMQFEEKNKDNFIPICVTDVFLGTYMWLQTPTYIDKLAKRKLIVESYCILKPTDHMIRKYLVEVENCFQNKKIEEDDYLLLRASSVFNEMLVENVDNIESITENTPLDMLDKLKSQSKEEGLRKYYAERDIRERMENELASEKQKTGKFKDNKRQKVEKYISRSFDGVVSFVIVLVVSVATLLTGVSWWGKIIGAIFLNVVALFSFWGLSRKHSFYEDWKKKYMRSITDKIINMFWGGL